MPCNNAPTTNTPTPAIHDESLISLMLRPYTQAIEQRLAFANEGGAMQNAASIVYPRSALLLLPSVPPTDAMDPTRRAQRLRSIIDSALEIADVPLMDDVELQTYHISASRLLITNRTAVRSKKSKMGPPKQ